jgi:DnaD/phage-associated family protein
LATTGANDHQGANDSPGEGANRPPGEGANRPPKKESIKESIKEKDNNNNPFDFYQQNFGQMGSFIMQDLAAWIDDLSEELVVEAMKRALEQNKKSWGYIKSILKDWAHKNIGSLQDVEAADVEFNNRKGGANKNGEHGQGNEEFNEQWGKALKQRKHTGAEF